MAVESPIRPKPEPDPSTASLADVMRQAVADGMLQGANVVKPRRENPNYTPDSVFAPRDIEKPRFSRRYQMNYQDIEWAFVTPEEVRLLEKLKAGDYHRNSRGIAEWVVTERLDGNTKVVNLQFPHRDMDQRMSLPSLRRMLIEMTTGEPAS